MAKKMKVRERGKISLSKYFKKIEEGTNVAIVKYKNVRSSFPKRLNGISGKVVGTRGRYKIIEIKDGSKIKKFIIHPVHLRRL